MALPVRAASEVFLNALVAAKIENFLNSQQLFPRSLLEAEVHIVVVKQIVGA